MFIHTNTLSYGDLGHALKTVGLNDVWIVGFETLGSRSHARKFKLYLRAERVEGRRRPNQNVRQFGSDEWSPTYDEYGKWMAELYRREDGAKIAFYKDADDFHKQTKGAFK
jgi:hypothetical protein